MKINRLCLLILSLLAIVLPAVSYSAPTRGIVPVAIKSQGGKQVLLYKESHALVIGVSEYTSGWPRLPGVLDDLREVTKVLESQGFNVVVVQNPTREMMEKSFSDFINKYGRGEDNRLLFYFAGHGYTDKPKHGGAMGYIVPADAPDPNRDLNGFLNKAMDMEMFNVYAKRVRAKHALFLFDSCFSGSLFALSRAIPEVIQEKTSKAVRQFITAGTEEQTVPDRSLFRDQFVRALSGEADMNKDGYVTGTELGQFLEDKVTNYSHRSQTPKYGTISDPNLDKGDFVFSMKADRIPADMEQEKQNIIKERTQFEEKGKNLEAEKQLAEERRKLEETRERVAKLEQSKPEKKSSSAPAGMVRIVGDEFTAGLDLDKVLAECRKYIIAFPCDKGLSRDEKPHRESVRTFNMDKYEVTQSDYERVMGNNPSKFKGSNLPVESVTWYEANDYCRKLGKRLPTEWEWEFAAKGGRNTIYAWGGDTVESGKANFCDRNCESDWKSSQFDDGYKSTSPVGSYPPNGYGLYDMAGNVEEWTASDYNNSGEYKVLRGGSWNTELFFMRTAYRTGYHEPGYRYRNGDVGFRCSQ